MPYINLYIVGSMSLFQSSILELSLYVSSILKLQHVYRKR